jgi:hypothetical protein
MSSNKRVLLSADNHLKAAIAIDARRPTGATPLLAFSPIDRSA